MPPKKIKKPQSAQWYDEGLKELNKTKAILDFNKSLADAIMDRFTNSFAALPDSSKAKGHLRLILSMNAGELKLKDVITTLAAVNLKWKVKKDSLQPINPWKDED